MKTLGRGLVVCGCLLANSAYMAWALSHDAPADREPLAKLSASFEGWNSKSVPVPQDVLDNLHLDDYLNREYVSADRIPVTLYIGYYGGLRTGSSIGPHSPLLCLPGMGWELVNDRPMTVTLGPSGQTIETTRAIAQNGMGRLLVMFWYQVHGKAVPTEAKSKLYLFMDALRARGTDGALVRIVAPITTGDSEASAEHAAVSFIQSVYPRLNRHLPG